MKTGRSLPPRNKSKVKKTQNKTPKNQPTKRQQYHHYQIKNPQQTTKPKPERLQQLQSHTVTSKS